VCSSISMSPLQFKSCNKRDPPSLTHTDLRILSFAYLYCFTCAIRITSSAGPCVLQTLSLRARVLAAVAPSHIYRTRPRSLLHTRHSPQLEQIRFLDSSSE
jgi:hypothetical protein